MDADGERIPDDEMRHRSVARVDDGQITGAVNLYFLTSLRTIAAWAQQYPDEAEDAEFDVAGRLTGCESEQLFISRSRAANVKAIQAGVRQPHEPSALPARPTPALCRLPPPGTG